MVKKAGKIKKITFDIPPLYLIEKQKPIFKQIKKKKKDGRKV